MSAESLLSRVLCLFRTGRFFTMRCPCVGEYTCCDSVELERLPNVDTAAIAGGAEELRLQMSRALVHKPTTNARRWSENTVDRHVEYSSTCCWRIYQICPRVFSGSPHKSECIGKQTVFRLKLHGVGCV